MAGLISGPGVLLGHTPGGAFDPTAIDGLTGWWRSTENLTLTATMWRSTSSLPAATLSGTPAAEPIGLWIEVTTGGALGVAECRYSVDNCATWIAEGVTIEASLPLVGPLAGMSVTFPDDDYVTGHYARMVDAWGSMIETNALGHSASTPTGDNTAPATFLANAVGSFGAPYFGAVGSAWARLATGLARVAKTLFCVARRDNPVFAATAALLANASGSSWWPWRVASGTTVFQTAGSSNIPAGTWWKDGIETADVGAGSAHLYARTLEEARSGGGIMVGNHTLTPRAPWGGPVLEVMHFNRDLTTDEWNYIHAGLAARYGISVTLL